MFKLRSYPLRSLLKSDFYNAQRCLCSSKKKLSDEEREKELKRLTTEFVSLDEPPTTCCQSGCAQCVYIAWAEAITAKMQNAGPEIAERILKNIEDPSMKAYLELELKSRGIIKKDKK